MGLITSAGVGSGIDVETIIGAILDAERSPKEASLRRNELRVDSTLSALGQLSSALDTLNEALNNLNSLDDFQLRSAISSDEDILSATTNSETSIGNFSIEVNNLARGSRVETTGGTFTDVTDTVGSGTLTFTAGADTFDVTVGAADSLETIRDNINANADNFGVNANIINGATGPILVYTSTITGDTNTLDVTNSNASLDSISTTGMTTTQTALSANATIDGIAVSSETNTFENIIQDLTFTVKQETEVATPVTLAVSIDKEGIKEAINTFVDAINEFQSISQRLGQSSEDSAGQLAGDVTLRLLSQQVVTTLQDAVTGLSGNFTTLNSLGISFDEFGQIQVDDDTLDSVVNSNFDSIGDIFASTDGVSIKLQNLVDNYIGSGSIIDIRETSLNNQKRQLETDRLNFDYRMGQLETQLRSKFGAMDTLVAQFNNTGSFLTQQLSNISGGWGGES